MKNGFQRFLTGFTLYTLVIALVSSSIYIWLPEVPLSPAYPYILVLIFLLTVFIIYWLMKDLQARPKRFVNTFMLINFAKLFLYVIIIFVYAWFNREDAVGFIITFFAYYLLFTGYEIVVLLKLSKKASS